MKYLFKEILLIGIIPIIIFWINVNYGIHRKDFNQELVDFLIENDSVYLKINLNERLLTKERVKRDSVNPINTVVLGSSRSMIFGKPIGRLVKNYSMNGAILSDFENVYSEIKNSKVEFDTIYIEISPWLFNTNINENRFKDWNNEDNLNLSSFKKLLSIKYFLNNISINKFGLVVDVNEFIKYSDGSIKYDKKYRTRNSQKRILDYIKKFPIYHLEGFNEISNLNDNSFVKFVSKISLTLNMFI